MAGVMKRISCAVACTAMIGTGLCAQNVSVCAASDSFKTIASETIASETAASITIASQTVAPVTITSETTASETMPEDVQDGQQEGLRKENGQYCYYEDGQPVTDRWVTAEEGTFYFNEKGKASVLSCKIDGEYFVFDQEGRLIRPSDTKIVKIETEDGQQLKYYVDAEGRACGGWSDDKKYYFDETGAMVTGITVIKEKFYSFNANGKFNKEKTQKIRKTAKYEKPFSGLQKYIGKPKKAKYYASCYGRGKDGILTYEGFTVYTFKPDKGTEIFMGVE